MEKSLGGKFAGLVLFLLLIWDMATTHSKYKWNKKEKLKTPTKGDNTPLFSRDEAK